MKLIASHNAIRRRDVKGKILITTAKKTPLAETHIKLDARMVDFAGWYMPVRYTSIITEHMAVRQAVGLFDVSHMGEFTVQGAGAHDFVQYVIVSDLDKLAEPNSALYTQFLNFDGGIVDDLIVYRRKNDYLLVVNASNIDKNFKWLKSQLADFPGVQLKDESDTTALLALQGPEAVSVMQSIIGEKASALKSFHYLEDTADGIKMGIARTGYTGEDGFELFTHSKDVVKLWQLLIKHGEPFGIQPCGLGARDTLRLEACYPLYGHELDDATSPLEADLGWCVKLNKSNFIGKDKLLKQKENGLPKKLVGLVTEARALPRQGYAIKAGNKQVGTVTSGSQGIYVGYPIAMGYVQPEFAKAGQLLAVEIRGKDVPAHVVAKPFYKKGHNSDICL